ncbi:MAG: fructosamine kinase family protein [Anaerolineae bacterium]
MASAVGPELSRAVDAALRVAGDTGRWEPGRSLGGSQSAVVRLRTGTAEYVLKHGMAPEVATAEARGLRLLAATGTVRVPEVIGSGEEPAFVLLEHVAACGRYDGARLGRELAALHRSVGESYGLDHDNFCGRTPQRNTATGSWIDFFRDFRLEPQGAIAARAGRMPAERARRLDALMARLDAFIDEDACSPSLIHGDLWGGNAITGPEGEPVLIDPAVSYSEREAELAMMRLFGGFSEACFAAYDEAWPLPAGWRERSDLYQLYHLLNHLNLFGEGYGVSVDAVLRRYA